MNGLAPAGLAPSISRFFALCAFALWQGGFVFYAGVVVPIGSDEFGDTAQGFVTRRVTFWLNLVGFAAVGLLLVDYLARPLAGGKKAWFKALWGLMLVCQTALVVLHPRMDLLLEPETVSVLDRKTFRLLHQVYLWTSTVMWVASLGWLWLVATGLSGGEGKEKPRA